MPRDYLIFFRSEILRTVNWAGDPDKVYAEGSDRPRLTPRKSFELWQEMVRGQSMPWTAAELQFAEGLRITLLEVILQLADLAARERKGAQERQELMIAELNHRVRNILSLMRGLVTQSKDTATSRGIHQRARRPHPGAGARPRPDHQPELGAGGAARAGRIRGRRLSRRARRPHRAWKARTSRSIRKAFATLALVVHEMMTNSAKYGALADSTGKVEIALDAGREFEPRDRLEGERRPAGAAADTARLRHHHHRALDPVRSQGRRRDSLRPARRAGAIRDPGELCGHGDVHADASQPRRSRNASSATAFRHGADRRRQSHHRHERRGDPARTRRAPCRYGCFRQPRRSRRSAARSRFRAARSQPRQREQHSCRHS